MTKPATDTELLDAMIQRCEHIRDFGNATHVPELAVAVQRLAMMVKDMKSNVSKPVITETTQCHCQGGFHYWGRKKTTCDCGSISGLAPDLAEAT